MPWISVSLGRAPPVGSVGDDIDVLSAPNHFKALQPQIAVAGAFAGFQVIFVAVPGTHKMNFVVGEPLPMPGAVRTEHIFDLVHQHAFAGRSALMQAQVLVGIERALPMEHADLTAFVADDAPLAVGKLRDVGDEDFRHADWISGIRSISEPKL